jgi:hypothetical protein
MTPKIEHKVEDGIEKKWCGKCQTFKPLNVFGNSKSTWDNYRPTCKECLKENNAKPEVKEKKTEYNKQYWEDTKEEQTEKSKKWREENKEHVKQKHKEWRENNKEYIKEKDKNYREANWDKIKAHHREYVRIKYHELKNDPSRAEEFAQCKIKRNISRRIREILGQEKSETCMTYTGCSLDKLRSLLESTMLDGMIWQNYGTSVSGKYKYCWHIDHIIPVNAFNWNNIVEQKACSHYSNLRAFWWDDNIIKHDTFDPDAKSRYMRWFIETQIPYV